MKTMKNKTFSLLVLTMIRKRWNGVAILSEDNLNFLAKSDLNFRTYYAIPLLAAVSFFLVYYAMYMHFLPKKTLPLSVFPITFFFAQS